MNQGFTNQEAAYAFLWLALEGKVLSTDCGCVGEVLADQWGGRKLLKVELRSSRLVKRHAIPAHCQQTGWAAELAKQPGGTVPPLVDRSPLQEPGHLPGVPSPAPCGAVPQRHHPSTMILGHLKVVKGGEKEKGRPSRSGETSATVVRKTAAETRPGRQRSRADGTCRKGLSRPRSLELPLRCQCSRVAQRCEGSKRRRAARRFWRDRRGPMRRRAYGIGSLQGPLLEA